MLFRDNRDFLKKFEFPTLFAHFEANFEPQNVNKISIKIFVKMHYFSVEIEKKIEKSTKITYNHKNLDKS